MVIIIVVLIAAVLLWKGGILGPSTGKRLFSPSPAGGTTVTPQTGAGGQTGEQTTGGQAGAGSIGKITDEIYIEIIAQTAYQTQKGPAGLVQGFETLLNEYGVTQENMDAYAAKISNDPQRAQEVMQKYMQRLTELQKAGK